MTAPRADSLDGERREILDVILHIGRQKTGSTFIQASLEATRRQLARRGVLYPAAFGSSKSRFIRDFFEGGRRLEGRVDEVGAVLDREFARRSWDKAIISNENLFVSSDEVMRALEEFVASHKGTPRVFCYVRRPDEHVVSLYQQRVRTGGMTLSLNAFVTKVLAQGYYRQAAYLDRWRARFGADAVHVRLFHSEVIRVNPFEDFMAWIGVPTDALRIPARRRRIANESYDPVGVDVLRFVRRWQNENPGAIDDAFFFRVRHNLRALNGSQRLRLSTAQATRLYEACREDCERLAREYLPDDQARLLLAPPQAGAAGATVDAAAVVGRAIDAIGWRSTLRSLAAGPAVARDGDPDGADSALVAALAQYRAAHPRRLDEAALAAVAARFGEAQAPAGLPPEPYAVFSRLMRALPADASLRGRLARGWTRLLGMFGRLGAAERRAEARRARKAKRRGTALGS